MTAGVGSFLIPVGGLFVILSVIIIIAELGLRGDVALLGFAEGIGVLGTGGCGGGENSQCRQDSDWAHRTPHRQDKLARESKDTPLHPAGQCGHYPIAPDDGSWNMCGAPAAN